MEVVLHAVAQDQDTGNSVHNGCSDQHVSIPLQNNHILTDTRGVLAEVTGLVAADETGRLNLGGRATGETGVEIHHALHASGILSGADSLEKVVSGVSRWFSRRVLSLGGSKKPSGRHGAGRGKGSGGRYHGFRTTHIRGGDLEEQLAS